MRILVIATLLSALFGLGSCKHKTQQDPPEHVAGSAGSAAGSAGAATSTADVPLPAGPGTKPDKTTKPLDRNVLKKLSELEYPGFKRVVRSFEDTTLEVRHSTESRPRIAVTVTISPCTTPCTPMQLEPWKARTEELKSIMSKELRGRPDTQWEIGATELHGESMIFTYQLGQWFGVGEDGKQHGSFSNAYILYYNDGVNQIRVVSEYKDDPVATKEDLTKLVPRDDLDKVGHAFLDAYTHSWS